MTCVPSDAWRLAGFRTTGRPQRAISSATSAGPETGTDSGLAMPAAALTARRTSLSRSTDAAP